MFSSDAQLFFEAPTANRQPPNYFGVLYLLRRDIFHCMGIDPNTNQPLSEQIIWPGVMSILAGIDLLGKFYAGNDTIGQVSQRFKDYIDKYFHDASTKDKDVIYQLRNSLLHSFGLYSRTNNGNIFRFTLGQKLTSFIVHTPPDNYLIDIRKLHDKFEDSIMQYCNEVTNDTNLQNKFNAMFPNYGKIKISSKPASDPSRLENKIKNISQLVKDFKAVAKQAGVYIPDGSITVETLRTQHSPPSSLPSGKMAVYVFLWGDDCLKVGKVGPKSQARYTSQHYNPNSSNSNLAKSIINHKKELGLPNLTNSTVGEWIKANTDRLNFILDQNLGIPVLSLMESFFQCRLRPRFEGFDSQK